MEKILCVPKVVLQKNFVKRIENLPQHLSEKFIGDNLLINDTVKCPYFSHFSELFWFHF